MNANRAPATAAAKVKIICKNRRALHAIAIDTKLEAGLALLGTEVKSCRAGQAHLNEAYVRMHGSEAFLANAYIAEYSYGHQFNHETTRTRKLLLHRRELDKLHTRLQRQGETAVPLALYFKHGKVKVEIGVGKGRSKVDRRARIKEREVERQIRRTLSSKRRA